jgi:hypothetical protein
MVAMRREKVPRGKCVRFIFRLFTPRFRARHRREASFVLRNVVPAALRMRAGAGSCNFAAMQTTIELEQLGEFAATSHIERVLESVPQVDAVTIEDGKAHVEHRGADLEELLEALRVLGYDRAQIATTT